MNYYRSPIFARKINLISVFMQLIWCNFGLLSPNTSSIFLLRSETNQAKLMSWTYIGHVKPGLVAMRHAFGGHAKTCGTRPCRQAMTHVMRPCIHGCGCGCGLGGGLYKRPMVGRRGHTPFLELERKLLAGPSNDIERRKRTKILGVRFGTRARLCLGAVNGTTSKR